MIGICKASALVNEDLELTTNVNIPVDNQAAIKALTTCKVQTGELAYSGCRAKLS